MRLSEPVVGVMTDFADVDDVGINSVRTRYLEALTQTAGVTPVLLPTTLRPAQIDSLIGERLDGILLTGASSNVHPARFSQALSFEERLTDTSRDDVAIEAILSSVKHCKPVFGICRGLQEVNVAFGGTLHQDLSKVPGAGVHHEDLGLPRNEQYGAAHTISLERQGSLFECVRNSGADIWVNSLHRQAIDQLGDGLTVEAVAPDGIIEAISATGTLAPVFAVQWHLEWFHDVDPVSRGLLCTFGRLCRFRAQRDAFFEDGQLAKTFRRTLAGL
ncbi:gamma-glutamyl-gamma-aminobutyrate hydrolase family protein [Bradyrhizobium sp. SZCCHNRI1003]|uniref:gamma-glutamyl-gamma-aminobutyrate hydrolase family protein n=1 Tax=Bradyrhizobium sp. SZCCHNRI1003 TaxID=3057275 RepID=UPI002916234F|nr:gamma-glutamyl-gamma-aminobutyrate hydrolase family protein [Bradyrhizobium sp. SZCCHNRI1003]